MKQITLRVPEKKVNFVMELIKNLGMEIIHEVDIPDSHKTIVRERILKDDIAPQRLLDWNQEKDSFNI